jgi:hypothetical protein
MKRSGGQFPTCDNCGREIRDNALKVASRRKDEYQMFHKDAHGCATAPEQRELRGRIGRGSKEEY